MPFSSPWLVLPCDWSLAVTEMGGKYSIQGTVETEMYYTSISRVMAPLRTLAPIHCFPHFSCPLFPCLLRSPLCLISPPPTPFLSFLHSFILVCLLFLFSVPIALMVYRSSFWPNTVFFFPYCNVIYKKLIYFENDAYSFIYSRTESSKLSFKFCYHLTVTSLTF